MSTPPRKPSNLPQFLAAFTPPELVTGAGCAVVVLSMFFKWMTYQGGAFGVNGFHGWGFATFLVAAATAVLFAARSPFFRNTVALPRLPVADAVAFVVAGAVEIATILLFSSEYSNASGISRSHALGFYLALLGAAATAVGGVMALRRGSAVSAPLAGTPSEPRQPPAAPPGPPPAPPPPPGGGPAT